MGMMDQDFPPYNIFHSPNFLGFTDSPQSLEYTWVNRKGCKLTQVLVAGFPGPAWLPWPPHPAFLQPLRPK